VSDGKHRVLVVFVDALGPRQLDRFGGALASFPHRRALRGVLGYSSGALATVLTGSSPSVHGRMCLFARAEAETSPLRPLTALGLLPRLVHERGRLRRMVAKLYAQIHGLTGYVALHRVPPEAFSWLDLPEREDLFAADDVGGAPTFLADARAAGLSVYASPWQLSIEGRWSQALDVLARRAPDLTFLYAPELDGVLHANGADAAPAVACRVALAASIERARDALAKHGEVTTLLVGDHGMAEVERVVDPRGLAPTSAGQHFVDSTMMRCWGTERELAAWRASLDRAAVPGRWLDAEALAARHAPVEGAPYGDAVFVLDEGTIFAPSFVGGRAKGMHGYDLDATSCEAALASDHPLPEHARRLEDVAGLVRSGLGLAS
jgi:hypothetical protein